MINLKDIYKKHKQIIPLLLLLWYCLLIVIDRINENVNKADGNTSENEHYYAFITTLSCLIIYFVYRQAYKYILIPTLLLGSFNVINFSLYRTTYFFTINSLSISFAPKAFFVLLVVFILNIKKLSTLVSGSEAETEERIQQLKKHQNEEEYNRFLTLFGAKGNEELQEIAKGHPYSELAVAAANDLLLKRKQGAN
jgi:hypothetical protein